MTRLDSFVATVGVQLIENNPCLPWRTPVPPALAGARGWFGPTGAGPMIVHVMGGDGLDADAIREAAQQWQAWLETMRASESLLIVAWERSPDESLETFRPWLESPWPVWLVDLENEQIHRPPLPPEGDGPGFLAELDACVGAYFQGRRLKPADLAEQEAARMEGKVPFGVFLREQTSPASWVLLGVIGGMFALSEALGGSADEDVLVRMGANLHPLVADGEVWRLVTANFLHGGYVHLLVNAVSLFAIGPFVEKLYGSWKFLVIFLVAGVVGAFASFLGHPATTSVGASGALFGLLGAVLILSLRHKDAIPDHQKHWMRDMAIVMLTLNLGYGLINNQSIDNYCHFGGLVGGFVVAAVLGPHPKLLARPIRPWLPRVLAIFPLIAALMLGYGLWHTVTGQVSYLTGEGPSHDFTARLPLFKLSETKQALTDYIGTSQRYVRIASQPNWASKQSGERPALSERTLELFAPQLASTWVHPGTRLQQPVAIVQRGHHRFVRLDLARPDAEEVYITASPKRIFTLSTRGLSQEPWVGRTLDSALATFTVRDP